MVDKVIDVDFSSLLPEDAHQLAYEIWSTNGYPPPSSLCTMLGLHIRKRFEIISWKDGTFNCECPWHIWWLLEAQRERLFELQENNTDFATMQKQKSEVLEAINLRKRDDLRLLQTVLDTVSAYVTGKKVVTEEGEVLTIPRLQPRTWKDIVETIDKIMKLKQLLSGGATERREYNIPAPVSLEKISDAESNEDLKKLMDAQNKELLAILDEVG